MFFGRFILESIGAKNSFFASKMTNFGIVPEKLLYGSYQGPETAKNKIQILTPTVVLETENKGSKIAQNCPF